MHPTNPATPLTLSRNSRAAQNGRKHADDHRGERGRRAADLDARHRHHHHLPPQTQEQEAGEGAD